MLIHDIALTMIPEVGVIRARRLIECFGSSKEALQATAADLMKIAEMPTETAARIAARLHHNDIFIAADNEIKFLQKNKITPILINDAEYPEKLRECCDPPLILYKKGEVDLNSKHMLSIVGTRHMTEYGARMCDEIVRGIAAAVPDAIIVSGLAYGIDVEAQKAAHRYGLKSVSVVANNLKEVSPSAHRSVLRQMILDGGVVVTEMNTLCQTTKGSFIQRNRIIAGMTSATLVVESPERGGSLATARCANDYNRDVMAVPGRVGDKCSEGCNRLINKDKATLVTSAEDVLDVLGWCNTPHKKCAELAYQQILNVNLSPEETQVYDAISTVPTPIDHIIWTTKLPVHVVSCIVMKLEFDSLVKSTPGNTVVRL